MAALKVHGSVFSTATMRVLACLYEKELEFEFVPVDIGAGEHKKEPFISLNPFGQVPAFEDGDLQLFAGSVCMPTIVLNTSSHASLEAAVSNLRASTSVHTATMPSFLGLVGISSGAFPG